MNIVKNWGVLLVIAGVLSGCGPEHDHKGKTPLVEVAGEYLYKEDLQAALPFNISKDDSVLFAEHYIRNWVEDVLLFDKAEGNIPDNAKIAKLVENYRRALIMHTYQEELVNQKLANEISDEEISAYYEKNKELFHTEHPFVKGLFIKVPLHSQDLASVRKWYKKNNQDAIENLEKYRSVCLPFTDDCVARSGKRWQFNIVGCVLFIVLYLILPESMYPYIGMIGGIGVGYSAGYAWQTAFNTFGALSIAAGLFGMPMAVALRVGMNVFGAFYTVICNKVIDRLAAVSEEKRSAEA